MYFAADDERDGPLDNVIKCECFKARKMQVCWIHFVICNHKTTQCSNVQQFNGNFTDKPKLAHCHQLLRDQQLETDTPI